MSERISFALDDEVRYRLLKYLADHPGSTQRELARDLGVSLGKVNYCIRALIVKGWLKMQNFKSSDNKSAYTYVLTPGSLQVPATAVEPKIEQALKDQGVSSPSVNCPDNIIVKVGTYFECDFKSASGHTGSVKFTFSDASGTVDTSSVEPA